MRVDVTGLMGGISADASAAEALLDGARGQEAALRSVASDASAGSSLAYGALRSYIEELRLPAAALRGDYLSRLAQDLRTDRARASEALAGLGSPVDTGLIADRADARRAAARALSSAAASPMLHPEVGALLAAAADELRRQASEIEGGLERALSYINDGSIYSGSLGYAGRLSAAAESLARASFDPEARAYDLSGLDLSWRPDESAAEYWRERNRRTLSRYVVLDEDGNFSAFRASGRIAELLLFGASYLLGDGTLSDALTRLTPDDKYFVAWALCELPPEALAAELAAAGAATQAAPGLPSELLEALGEAAQGGHVPLLSDVLSFTADDGMLYALNVKGSIQQRSGFSDVIDLAGPLLGMDLDTQVVTFSHGGREYRLQTWDGSYGAGTAFGGEVALYSRDDPGAGGPQYEWMGAEEARAGIDALTAEQVESLWATYDTARDEDQPEIEIEVFGDGGKKLIERNAGKTYWNYTASAIPSYALDNCGSGFKKSDTTVKATLSLPENPGLLDAMEEALAEGGYDVHRDAKNQLVINWGQP